MTKRERANKARKARRVRRKQRIKRDLAIVGKRSDAERHEHMARIAERELKPRVGDLVTGRHAVRELERIEAER